MLNKIKLVLGIIIVVCLFLPLSSCQYEVPKTQGGEPEVKTEYYYAIPDKAIDTGVWRYAPIVLFCMPLLLAMIALIKNSNSWLHNLTGIVLAAGLSAYWYVFYTLTALEFGGYLLIAAAIAYLLSNILGLYFVIKLWRMRKSGHHSL